MDPEELKKEALDSLLGTVDGIRGNKVLVLDRSLLTTLSIVTTFSVLKEHGVGQIVWLQSTTLDDAIDLATCNAIIYLMSSSSGLRSCKTIASHAQKVVSYPHNAIDLNLIVAPSRTLAIDQCLEEYGVLGDFAIHTWAVYFLPLESDILSLNLPDGGFQDTYLHEITGSIYHSAQAIQEIQVRHGLIGRITGKGEAAHKLAELIVRNRQSRRTNLAAKDEESKTTQDVFDHKFSNLFVGTAIDQLIIIDRKTDFLTPLLSQLTYLGLINEFYKVSDYGQVDLPASIVQSPQKKKGNQQQQDNLASISAEKKSTLLYSGNPSDLFSTIKDLNFAVVGQSLNKVAKQLQSDYDRRHEAKTVSEIKQFVSKLGGLQTVHQNLRFHTALAEDLMEKVQGEEFNKWLEVQQNLVADTLDLSTLHAMVEDLIDRGSSLSMVLRLLAIECICNGGIKQKDLLYFKHEIVQTYGYQHVLTLDRLEKLGILYARAPTIPNTFPTTRKQLKLISEQTDEDPANPSDITFAFSGYAPLSVRLVQCVVDKGSILKPKRFSTMSPTPTNGSTGTATTALLKSSNAASAMGAGGWKGAEDILKTLQGPSFDEIQRSESHIREGKLRKILARNSENSSSAKPTVMVFYLGGITYAEIAALRFIAQRNESLMNLVIATTGIISGERIIDLVATTNRA
ncbi:vacuolar protein sorting-associated protein 33 [Trichomonascus vanleenenianus]|uniref:tethering complex ATP-binding subunit VPS33 n=1 Tax=Trichomonascus vanleenenianus TaxID=2268995 RepID=UPI003EC9AD36